MSKLSSDHYVLFVTPRHRCVIMREVDAYKDRLLSYTAQFDTTLRNKCYCKSWNAQIDKSLRKICRYQQNVPQHYYLLDTLVYISYSTFCCVVSLSTFKRVVPYFDERVGLVKILTTSKNTRRYYTTKCLIRDLLSNTPNCYVRAGEFRGYLFTGNA